MIFLAIAVIFFATAVFFDRIMYKISSFDAKLTLQVMAAFSAVTITLKSVYYLKWFADFLLFAKVLMERYSMTLFYASFIA